MGKICLIAWVLIELLILNISAQTTSSADGQRCLNDSECPNEMCCVHNPLAKPEARKRFLFADLYQQDHGFCRRTQRLQESCWPLGHNAVNNNLYDFFCPCEIGLECRGLVVHESQNQIVHMRPVCQDPESSLSDNTGITFSGQVCSIDTDCPSGMCCVTHPLTSRRRQVNHGYCRNERKFNETCNPIEVHTHDFECPCESGLECRGTVVHQMIHQTVHENPVCQTPRA